MRPPAVITREVCRARPHATAAYDIVFDEAAVRAVDEDSVAAEIVHAVFADHHIVTRTPADDTALVDALDGVALDEHVIDGGRLVGRVTERCAVADDAHKDGRAVVAYIEPSSSHLSPDVVYVIVLDDKMPEVVARAGRRHGDALTADTDFERGL